MWVHVEEAVDRRVLERWVGQRRVVAIDVGVPCVGESCGYDIGGNTFVWCAVEVLFRDTGFEIALILYGFAEPAWWTTPTMQIIRKRTNGVNTWNSGVSTYVQSVGYGSFAV